MRGRMPKAKPFGYWTWNGSRNGLAGVEGDPSNPPVMHEDFIVYALHTSRIAQAQFSILFKRLLPEEQERLASILARHPMARKLVRDPVAVNDRAQTKEAREGVRTKSGPRGGTQVAGTYTAEPVTLRDLT